MKQEIHGDQIYKKYIFKILILLAFQCDRSDIYQHIQLLYMVPCQYDTYEES